MVGRERLGAIEAPALRSKAVRVVQVRCMSATVEGVTRRVVRIGGGEILGIAGVIGNGQDALAEALAGLARMTAGDVVLDGISIACRSHDGATAVDVAYMPERPLDNAVVAGLDLGVNLALGGCASCR